MFRFLTAGESHGRGLFGILEGLPSGLSVTEGDIQKELIRRKQGFGRGDRQKIEGDRVEIFSGVRDGRTLGSPVCLGIWNQDWENWKDIMSAGPVNGERTVDVPRPGHADLVGGVKYAHEDMRNVLERASARETAMRVALGAVARKLLLDLGIGIASRVISIGGESDDASCDLPYSELNETVDRSSVRCLAKDAELRMVRAIQGAQETGDTLGGTFEVVAYGLPVGLGSYVQWDRRLEGELSRALCSLNAIKGVEFGLGFSASRLPGSAVHDEILPGRERGKVRYATNASGGIEGGMSTGQPLWVRAAMKPLSTLMKPLMSVELKTGQVRSAHVERSDTCAVPAASVIGESLVALVLTSFVLEKFGGDSLGELQQRVRLWNESVRIEK